MKCSDSSFRTACHLLMSAHRRSSLALSGMAELLGEKTDSITGCPVCQIIQPSHMVFIGYRKWGCLWTPARANIDNSKCY